MFKNFITNLLVCMMLGMIVGTFVKTTELKKEVFCDFVTMVSAIVAEVPNNHIEFTHISSYTADLFKYVQMNAMVCKSGLVQSSFSGGTDNSMMNKTYEYLDTGLLNSS